MFLIESLLSAILFPPYHSVTFRFLRRATFCSPVLRLHDNIRDNSLNLLQHISPNGELKDKPKNVNSSCTPAHKKKSFKKQRFGKITRHQAECFWNAIYYCSVLSRLSMKVQELSPQNSPKTNHK